MNIIKLLPEETIKKISAGEFINRPYLILKELIENSIDAKSDLISIYFINKGLDLIKIIDNGKGISKNDLLMCVKKNSTSKIFFFEDLNNLNSLGFRGEALYSISGISNLIISSKTLNSEIGWCLFNNLNNVLYFNIKPISHNLGTTVCVKNIYFNIPIKRKELFLYKNNEWLLIIKIINYFIICNYNISFYIYNESKLYRKFIILDSIKYSILNRIKSIYGKKFIENNFYININNSFWHCNGFFFLNLNKFKKSIKIIFLNKRIISNKNFLFYIFNKFICDFLQKKNFSYILYFFIDNNYIDINICPDKSKIIFKNTIKLYNSLYNNLCVFFKKFKLSNILNDNKKLYFNNFNKVMYFNKYLNFNKINKKNYLQYFLFNFGKIINLFNNKYLISIKNNYLIFSNLYLIFYYFNNIVFKEKLYSLIWIKNILLIYNKNNIYNNININIISILYKLGIVIKYNNSYFKIIKIPLILFNLNFKKFLLSLNLFLYKIKNFKNIEIYIIYWLTNFVFVNNLFSINQSIILISNFCEIIKNINFKKKVFKIIDLSKFLFFLI